MKVLACTHDPQSAIASIRLMEPLSELAAQGAIELRLCAFHELRRSSLQWPDVAVMQRALAAEQLAWMHALQARGVGVIYEIDDLLIKPAPHLLQREALLASTDQVRSLIRAADVVTVSTEPLRDALAADLGARRASFHHVPNIGRSAVGAPASHRRDAPVVLILASSDVQQLDALGPALVNVLGDQRGLRRLLIVGPVAQGLRHLGLTADLVQSLPLMPHEHFANLLTSQVNPLALMPLDDSPFSRCKSAVKYFDYALAGVPAICANARPYADVVRHGVTGWLVEDTASAWRQAIDIAAADAELRARVAAASRGMVQRDHTPQRMADAWRLAFEEARLRRGPRRPAGEVARMIDTMLDSIAAPQLALRRANRLRLARRRAAG